MKDSLNKILVTGGAGYIGSILSGLLLKKGYKVRVIDNLSFGDASLSEFRNNPDFDFIKGDICLRTDVLKALEDIDCVVHLAAIVGDPACHKNPKLAKKINREGSELLYRLSHECEVKRFIFASTCSNYGKMPDSNGFVDEKAPLNPVSHYAELKVGFEKYLLENRFDNIIPVILRFATAYGLSPRMRFDLTVNEFTRDLALDRKLEIYGEQFWRPFSHTTDLAGAVLKAIQADNERVAYEAFNVGSNEENYQKKTLIDMILKQLPQSAKNVSFVSKDEDPRDYRVKFDKITNTLDYRQSQTVEDGIAEIIEAINSKRFKDPYDNCYRNS